MHCPCGYADLVVTLTDYLKDGLVSKCERGGSRRVALAHHLDPKNAHEAQYTKPVPLFDFLLFLVLTR